MSHDIKWCVKWSSYKMNHELKRERAVITQYLYHIIFKFTTFDWLWWLHLRYEYNRTYMFIYKTSRRCINGLSSFSWFILCKCLCKLSLNVFVINEYWQMNHLMNRICNFLKRIKSLTDWFWKLLHYLLSFMTFTIRIFPFLQEEHLWQRE